MEDQALVSSYVYRTNEPSQRQKAVSHPRPVSNSSTRMAAAREFGCESANKLDARFVTN